MILKKRWKKAKKLNERYNLQKRKVIVSDDLYKSTELYRENDQIRVRDQLIVNRRDTVAYIHISPNIYIQKSYVKYLNKKQQPKQGRTHVEYDDGISKDILGQPVGKVSFRSAVENDCMFRFGMPNSCPTGF